MPVNYFISGRSSTFVVPPVSRFIPCGLLVFQEPPVKSGTSIYCDLLATDHSLNGATELQTAPS